MGGKEGLAESAGIGAQRFYQGEQPVTGKRRTTDRGPQPWRGSVFTSPGKNGLLALLVLTASGTCWAEAGQPLDTGSTPALGVPSGPIT